jgi:hypothetical protein
VFNFTVFLEDFNVFEAVRVEFFDEIKDFFGLGIAALFGLRVGKKDRAVYFGLADEVSRFCVDKLDQFGGGVPGVEDDR